jgi:hypothetical protein
LEITLCLEAINKINQLWEISESEGQQGLARNYLIFDYEAGETLEEIAQDLGLSYNMFTRLSVGGVNIHSILCRSVPPDDDCAKYSAQNGRQHDTR